MYSSIIIMLWENHMVFCLLPFHLLHYKQQQNATQKAGTGAKGESLSDKTDHQ